ncbi:MAG: preprotein translocase subunit SecG [Bacteroidota bacterium]|nr:preprotein translocase subunit SecG [Bacteroidota bacterium]
MLIVFGTIIIIASIILGLIILIQNPKGGGLSSSLGGIGNQLMGVKQTTDVLEKGTWLFAGIIGVLCLTSAMFIPKTGGNSKTDNLINEAPVGTPAQPNNTTPLPGTAQPQSTVPVTPQK